MNYKQLTASYGLHKYLQTWHGTPLKKLANDMDEVHIPGTTTEKYKQNVLQQASNGIIEFL
ncbi:CDP-glycerol glycerophosphotransferase family protein [Bacillus sp. PK6-026]